MSFTFSRDGKMFLIRQKWTSPAWHSSTGVYVWVEVVVISLMTHLTGHPAGPRVPPVLDGRRGCGFLRKRRSGSSASVIVTARYLRLPPLLPVISLCRLLRKLPGDAASLECRRVAAVPCGAGRWPCASGRLHHTGMSPRWARLSEASSVCGGPVCVQLRARQALQGRRGGEVIQRVLDPRAGSPRGGPRGAGPGSRTGQRHPSGLPDAREPPGLRAQIAVLSFPR